MFDSLLDEVAPEESRVEPVESPYAGRSGSELAALIAANHAEVLRVECRTLELACAWADCHDRDALDVEYGPLVERARYLGGDGTPAIGEFCVEELGALQQIGSMAAEVLLADALDLRYRLPRMWAQVQAGQVRAWQARKVAEQTRLLPWAACADLDAALFGLLGTMTWTRFSRILAAAIVDADPAQAKARHERAKALRDVWASDAEDGLKTIVARAASGDAVWFLGVVNRIADILAGRGDTDPVGVRRSKAIGILARPAEALALLAAHRDQPSSDDSDADGGGGVEDPDDPDHPSLDVDPPTPAQLRAARPTVVLHFHLSDAAIKAGHGTVRPQHGEMLTLTELRDWLTGTGCPSSCGPSGTRPRSRRSTPMRSRIGPGTRSGCGTWPTCSPTAPAPQRRWTSTTPCRTCR